MDIKLLVISDDSDFSKGGEVVKNFSATLAPYNIGFKEAVILPYTETDSIFKIMSYMASGDSVVLVCGGMTEGSHIAMEAASKVLGRDLVKSKDAADLMKLVYELSHRKLDPATERSCYFPEKSFIIPNQITGLSGFYVTEPVFFAAIPLEPENAHNLFKNHMLGKILGKMGVNYFIKLKKYRLFGLKEKEFTRLLEKLRKIFDYDFASEYSFGEIIISVYANGISTQKLNENVKSIDTAVSDIFKGYLFGYDDDELYSVCSRLLKEKNAKLAVAESLTGGYISDKLTDLPGASSYFMFGGVVYSNFAKTEILGVDQKIIEKDGAVSAECAVEMAGAVRKKASSNIGLAVTGFAGPETEWDNHPVGTVFIALSTDKFNEVRKYNFSGNRLEIKAYTSKMALFWIYKLLEGMPSF